MTNSHHSSLPGAVVPPGGDDATLLDLFDAVVTTAGGREAMVECSGVADDGRPLVRRATFTELAAAADALAAQFVAAGVVPGDVVAVTLPSGIDHAVAHHAALRAGAVATALNPRLGPHERRHILAATAPAAIIDEPLGDLATLASGGDPHRRHVHPLATDTACIVWTGGTTGTPKGVVFDHRCQHAMAAAAGPLSAVGDRRLAPLPFAHVGTMTRVWDEWSHLITTVVTPTPWTPDTAAALLASEAITVCQGVPTQYALLCDLLESSGDQTGHDGGTSLPHLRIAGIGGARIPPDLVRRIESTLGVPVVARYASTETCIATGTTPGDPPDVVATTVGRPTPPVALRIVDDDGAPLPAGPQNVGIVCIRSRAVMRAYAPTVADEPETAPPSPVDEDGWCHTGDVGWVGEDGNLRLVGRSTELYIRGGYNVYPAEVENCLGGLHGVGAIAVVGAEAVGSRLGEVGVAFVVPDGDAPTLKQLRDHVATHLASYKAPDVVVVVEGLPLTAVGKVDKRALQPRANAEAARLGSQQATTPRRAP